MRLRLFSTNKKAPSGAFVVSTYRFPFLTTIHLGDLNRTMLT
ncbi:hypothetical protein QFZ99_002446 [Paraburkholderia atlantica]